MRRVITAFLFILPGLLCGESVLEAFPFRHRIVCAPKINPTLTGLEFRIRDGGPCGPDETWMQVVRQKDGIVHLYPIDPPLSPEADEELKEFKKYHGIER
ncbi:MAG: hypothetical protein R3257_00475 [bacterium]|nr:hypothetical protein [bacterium]